MTEPELDEAAFLAVAEPEAAQVLLSLGPELDPTEPLQLLRDRSVAALDAMGEPALPDGVRRRLLPSRGGCRPLRVFDPPDPGRAGRAVIWIHGGGLLAGVPRQDDQLCAEIAHRHRVRVVSVEYRVAPEHPYPAGLEDCYAAVQRVLAGHPEDAVGAASVLVAGASAGGGLAAAVALLARQRGLGGVAGLVLYYPMLDDRPGRGSMARFAFRRSWHRGMDELAWRCYLAGRTDIPSTAAPARATAGELAGFPPTFIDVGTLDAFLDEDAGFAARLARAGVDVELVVTKGAFHGSEALAPHTPSARRIRAARQAAFARLLDLP